VGLAVAGSFPWAFVPGYIAAQLLGGFCGAVLVYVYYKDHFDATDDPATKLGVFCTMPAIMDKPRNLFCEFLGTFLLVFVILAIGNEQNTPEIGMGSLGSLPVTMLIMAIGMSLGGTTGYAINPARDLPPRVAHSILPIRGKGTSGWGYSWVPVTGPVLGALAAGLIYGCVYMCG
ncbi:aquaporin family protein, partial [Alistipes onderdonkii]